MFRRLFTGIIHLYKGDILFVDEISNKRFDFFIRFIPSQQLQSWGVQFAVYCFSKSRSSKRSRIRKVGRTGGFSVFEQVVVDYKIKIYRIYRIDLNRIGKCSLNRKRTFNDKFIIELSMTPFKKMILAAILSNAVQILFQCLYTAPEQWIKCFEETAPV